MPPRPEFIEALRIMAEAVEAIAERGLPPPVLVGGAAVEIYTGGSFVTGDLDFVAEAKGEFEAALRERGFERQTGPGGTHTWPLAHASCKSVSKSSARGMDGAADEQRTL